MHHRALLFMMLVAGLSLAGPMNEPDDMIFDVDDVDEESHIIEKRDRRSYVVKCCGSRSCQGPRRRGFGMNSANGGTDYGSSSANPGTSSSGLGGTEEPKTPIDNSVPISCANLNFASLADCCTLHPAIFEYMDPDIRTCANRTSMDSDFGYYKSIVTNYMLNQAVTMKNKLDLRRIPSAVKFYDCFFKEREWIAQGDKGEVFNPAMTDEFIDNVDPSWDDLLTDALLNCSKVIKNLVPWPYMPLPIRGKNADDTSVKQVFQTYPILITQCMRKVLLSYCPAPNRPILSNTCNEMRAKFRVCDPFQQTADPPGEGDYADEYTDDASDSTSRTTRASPGGTTKSGTQGNDITTNGDEEYEDDGGGGDEYEEK